MMAEKMGETIFYFTKEQPKEKEIINNVKHLFDGEKLKVKYLGIYEGEDLEEIGAFNRDEVYRIDPERFYAKDILGGQFFDTSDFTSDWKFDEWENDHYTTNPESAEWLEDLVDAYEIIRLHDEENGGDILAELDVNEYDAIIELAKGL